MCSTSWLLIEFAALSPTLHILNLIILLQAVCLLQVLADLKAKANLLRKEALECLTVALAGSDTKKFWELMTAFSGTNHKGTDEDDPQDFLDAAPIIPPPLPLTEIETEEEAASVKSAPASTIALPTGGAKCKARITQQKDLLEDLCDLKDAIRMYPSSKETLKETVIPDNLLVKREHQTSHAGASMYLCCHPKCQDPAFYAQSPAGIYSLARRKHLGIAISCPYCSDKLYWNFKGWQSHMDSMHKAVPHFSSAFADEVQIAHEMLYAAEQQAKPATKKRRTRKPKPKKEKEGAPYPSCSLDSDTNDSSPDSSSSEDDSKSDTESSSDEESCQPTKSKLSSVQKEALMSGATAAVAEPTTEALAKYPSGKHTPHPLVTAHHDTQDVVKPSVISLAASLVLSDLPPEGIEDMPELEETPPPPFPTHAMSGPACEKC